MTGARKASESIFAAKQMPRISTPLACTGAMVRFSEYESASAHHNPLFIKGPGAPMSVSMATPATGCLPSSRLKQQTSPLRFDLRMRANLTGGAAILTTLSVDREQNCVFSANSACVRRADLFNNGVWVVGGDAFPSVVSSTGLVAYNGQANEGGGITMMANRQRRP